MPVWEDQWRRVERYYQRFEKMNNGFVGHGEPAEYYYDDMWAFFQNCLSLRDWLKEEKFKSSKYPDMSPAEYVHTNCLVICSDLANVTKHMKLKPNLIQSGSEPIIGPRSLAFDSPITILKASFEHDGKAIDAFTFATQCMKAWKAYLE